MYFHRNRLSYKTKKIHNIFIALNLFNKQKYCNIIVMIDHWGLIN